MSLKTTESAVKAMEKSFNDRYHKGVLDERRRIQRLMHQIYHGKYYGSKDIPNYMNDLTIELERGR